MTMPDAIAPIVVDPDRGEPAHASLGLGWDPAWADAFASFASDGRRPARVVAVHKETSIVRDGVAGHDRPATVTGRFRHDALAPSDYPAVGDWVVLEPTRPEAGPDDPAVIAAVLPRRSAFVRQRGRRRAPNCRQPRRRAGHGRQRRHRLPRGRTRRRLQPAPPGALSRGGLVQRRLAGRGPQQGRCRPRPGGPAGRGRIDRPGRARRRPLRPDRRPPRRTSAATSGPVATAVVLGSSGVGKSTLVNALLGEAAAGHGRRARLRLARPPHDHAPRTLRAARVAPSSSTRRASARSRSRGPTRAWRRPSTRSPTSLHSAGSPTADTGTSPAAPIRRALDDGTPQRRPTRESPEARTRARARRAQGRSAGPGRGTTAVEGHPQVGRTTDGPEVRRRPMMAPAPRTIRSSREGPTCHPETP